MKLSGYAYETWEIGNRRDFILGFEAEDKSRLVCGKYASKVVLVHLKPQPTPEDMIGILDGSKSYDQWVKPVEGDDRSFQVVEGLKVIFQDETLVTHNGFPQPHVTGPVILQEIEDRF